MPSHVYTTGPGKDWSHVPVFPLVGLFLTSANLYNISKKNPSTDLIGVSFMLGPAELFYSSEARKARGLNARPVNQILGGTTIVTGTILFFTDRKKKKQKSRINTSNNHGNNSAE
jgi:hypothetical protein